MKFEDLFNEYDVKPMPAEDDMPFVDAVGDTAEVYNEKEEDVR